MEESPPSTHNRSRLQSFSWVLIGYTLIIIAWGAWVRISGSGDGCGDHWPLCHGEAIPLGAGKKTWIEVSHRYSTALFGLLIIAQWFAILRTTYKKHPARFWILATLFFTATEALIGRMLVKEGLVTDSESLYRMVVMPLHLVNTSALLFSQVMVAEHIAPLNFSKNVLSKSTIRWGIALFIAAVTLLTSGAIAALGSHLVPSESLLAGLAHDLQSNSHLSVRLRIFHPLLGLALPALLYFGFILWAKTSSASPLQRSLQHLTSATFAMIAIGFLTLVTLAPSWLKLTHLTMANVLVILLARVAFRARWKEP